MLVFPIQTNWQSKCFRFFRTFWALFVKRYTLLFHILFPPPPPFPVYYTDDFLKQFPARFSSSSSCCLLQNQVLLEEREVNCCCCTCTFDSMTYSIWFIWFRSAFGIQQLFLNLFCIFWKECVIHAIFLPFSSLLHVQCLHAAGATMYVPGNFLTFYDRLIRYDHTCSYFVILIQVKGFWVLLNITLKCPPFLNILVLLHCYTLERGTCKS